LLREFPFEAGCAIVQMVVEKGAALTRAAFLFGGYDFRHPKISA
jgi:hypothetical protein